MKTLVPLALLVSCMSSPPPAAPAQPFVPVSPSASASITSPPAPPTPVATAPTAPPAPPEAPLRWGTRPPKTGDLFVAVGGLCRYLELFPADNTVLFGYGDHEPIVDHMNTVARLTETGIDDMSKGLSPSLSTLESASGHYPDSLMLVDWGGGRIGPSETVLLWKGEDRGWGPIFTSDRPNELGYTSPVGWRHGILAIETRADMRDPGNPGTTMALRAANLPAGVSPPPLIPSHFEAQELIAFENDGLAVFGFYEGKQDVSLIRWTEGTNVREQSLSSATHDDSLADGTHTIVTYVNQDYVLAAGHWSKADPKRAPTPDGTRWSFAGGKVYRETNGQKVEVTLPPPPFSIAGHLQPEKLVVTRDGEAIVEATYVEKGRKWKDPVKYRAVLRSHRPLETFRCNEPNPEDFNILTGTGFQSWPPVADASCTTPFVVLTRRSKNHTSPTTYPELRAALAAHPDLGAIDLVEFKSGDRVFVGAKAKDYDSATALLDAASARQNLRAEIVCGDPEPLRVIPASTAH